MPGPSSRTQRGREFGLVSAPWFPPPFQGSTLFNPYLGFRRRLHPRLDSGAASRLLSHSSSRADETTVFLPMAERWAALALGCLLHPQPLDVE